jgi:hypothetical protein
MKKGSKVLSCAGQKSYEEVEVEIHVFLTLVPECDFQE